MGRQFVPAVLIAHLAASTSTIRVGSGGVQLPNHAPLAVAEQFGTLEALHPGRVDLGIGRTSGTDQVTALALRRTTKGLSAEAFPQEFDELIGYFTSREPRLGITAIPALGNMPKIWLLGSGGFSAQLAGTLGLPFSFAHHFSSANTLPALDLYRQHFRPSEYLDKPYAIVSVNAICADTDERAEYLAGPAMLSFLRMHTGQAQLLASPEEAARYTPQELKVARSRFDGQALGSPETVARRLAELRERTGADELMLTTQVYDIEDRIRSFDLIAKQTATP
jgi:luciferase family oxidoreductase group 1